MIRISLTDRILQAKAEKTNGTPTFRSQGGFGQAGEASFGGDFGAGVSEEELFVAFAGYPSEKLIETYHLQAQGNNRGKFNGAVFFFPIPWFFYRKLYVYGVLTIIRH